MNTVATRRGTARDVTENNCAVGQTVTFLGTKEVEMSIRRAVGAAFKPFTTLYEGEEINSMIFNQGRQNPFETHKKMG